MLSYKNMPSSSRRSTTPPRSRTPPREGVPLLREGGTPPREGVPPEGGSQFYLIPEITGDPRWWFYKLQSKFKKKRKKTVKRKKRKSKKTKRRKK